MVETFQEVELKLNLLKPEEAPEIANTIKNLPEMELPFLGNPIESIYYDTPDHALYSAGWTYRIRKEKNGWTATVKGMGSSDGGLHKRNEWNLSIDEPAPSIEAFDVPEIQQILMRLVAHKELKPMIKTIFKREKGLWKDGEGNLVEIALDTGHIEADGTTAPINELELELKAGKPDALLILGKRISEKHAFKPGSESKFFRGVKLLGLEKKSDKSKKNRTNPVCTSVETVSDGFRKITDNALQQMNQSLELLTEDPKDPECLHQLRVSIRNIRSVLFLFRPSINREDYNRINQYLRQWHRETNEIRELDVMKEHLQEWIKNLERPEQANWMTNEVEKILGHKKKWLETQINEGKMTPKMLEAWHMLEKLMHELSEDVVEKPAKDFIDKRLNKLIRGFNQQAKKASIHNREELHRLRIRGKKIRYSIQNIQFGADQKKHRNKSLRKALKVAKKLQDLLGDIHDCHCEINWMRYLASNRNTSLEEIECLGRYEGWQFSKQYRLEEKLANQWNEIQIEMG